MKLPIISFSVFISNNTRLLSIWSVVLILLGILMQFSYIFAPIESLPHRPFEEDTFFHLSVCRNLATGNGLTIDGSTPTSGAQPGTLIYTLAYLFADDPFALEALRLVRTVGFIGSIFSSFAIFICTFSLLKFDKQNRFALGLLSCALWTISYQAFRTNLNGYETVFSATALLISISIYAWRLDAKKHLFLFDVLFGVSLSIAIYTRIDMGLWAFCSALSFLIFSKNEIFKKVLSVTIWTVTCTIVTLPFWIHNIHVGNSLMPISGKASAFQISFHGIWTSVGNCFLRGFNSIGEFGFISLYLPYSINGNLIGFIVAFFGILLIFLPICLSHSFCNYLSSHFSRNIAVPILTFMVLLFSYYCFMHGSWWFMRRYMHPERALFFAFSSIYISGLAFTLINLISTRRIHKIVIPALLAVITVISISQFVITWGDTKSNQMYEVANWLNNNIKNSPKIGAFQSGTLGYFCKNITNLDGKNNPYALDAMVSGNGLEYIKKQNLEYVVDWPSQIAKYINYDAFKNDFNEFGSVSASKVYQRK